MTCFIIVSKDKNKRDEYLKEFYKKHTIDPFDVTTLSSDTSVKQTSLSIGIEDIKQMQKKIFLKPLKSENKVIVIEDGQLLTIEAQNALLKVLEEPPANTFIIITAETKEMLLPTILSRCFIVDLGASALAISEKEKKELETFLEEFPQWGIGERLKKAEALAKDKDKAIAWIEKVILVTREKLLDVILVNDEATHPEFQIPNTLDTLKNFQSLHTLLKTTNVNPRFAIENTLLNISNK